MPELYFDVRKFNKEEFALLAIENTVGELSERVGSYLGFKVNRMGTPSFEHSTETDTQKKEIEALKASEIMARDGYTNFLWISGPGGDPKYTDTRITWLRVANVTPDEVYFDDNKAICSEIKAVRCVELAYYLAKNGGELSSNPETVEELRGCVIGFKDDYIIERLADALVEMEAVWQSIERGDYKVNLSRMSIIAEWVEDRYGGQMKGVRTEREAMTLGSTIEMQVRRSFGIKLMEGGAHGMSNSAALAQIVGGVFDTVYNLGKTIGRESLDPRLEICDTCGNCFIKRKKKCPKCYSND